MNRKITRTVSVGNVKIGGGNPISVQSMTNTDTHDFAATLTQVLALEKAGCDIVRLAVPDVDCASVFTYLKENGTSVPLVADIHFDYKIALAAIAAGADKIRINPGNIGDRTKVEAVVSACQNKRIPIRIGVNTGSLEPSILKEYGHPTAEALAKSALYHASILEDCGFTDTVLSVKASNVPMMIEANRLLSAQCAYPLHLGVTEAGASEMGIIKGAVGIGTLLSEGIGDTVRVSLTDDPVEEVKAAKKILCASGESSKPALDVVSCPTCGRTKIALIPLVRAFTERAEALGLTDKPIKVALMGCAVNGPGEARECDVGFAGGDKEGLIFKKGQILYKVPEEKIIDALIDEIRKM